MTDLERWKEDAADFGWTMPSASWWKRLPIIRHIRAAWLGWKVERHYALWKAMGAMQTGYDSWVLYGIAHGFERDE